MSVIQEKLKDLEDGLPVEVEWAEQYELDLLSFCRDTKRSKKRLEKHQRRLDFLWELKTKKGIEQVRRKGNGDYEPYFE